MAKYYAQRASAGLLITEGTHISLVARGWHAAPEIYTDSHATAWRSVTDEVHAARGLIFCQLWHTGRASHSNFRSGLPGFDGELAKGVAPSPIKRKSEKGVQQYTAVEGEVAIETPRALTLDEVKKLPEEYRNAAQMAKNAGFDGVEIHGANGYLLDEFLQSCSNERTDEYGGSLENRFRIMDEVIQAVLTVWDASRVSLRLSPNGAFNGMGSEDNREAFLYFARRLSAFKLGFLHVMIGTGFGFHGFGEPMTMREFRAVYDGVMIANVGYSAESAEKEIADGDTDLVAFGRPYLANPDLVERFRADAPLAPAADHTTFFSEVGNDLEEKGYTTYEPMSKTS